MNALNCTLFALSVLVGCNPAPPRADPNPPPPRSVLAKNTMAAVLGGPMLRAKDIAKAGIPKIGAIVTLKDEEAPWKNVYGITDGLTLLEIVRLLRADDQLGIELTLKQPPTAIDRQALGKTPSLRLANGTQAKIIAHGTNSFPVPHENFFTGDYSGDPITFHEVRILDGVHRGEKVYVLVPFVQPNP